MMLGFALIAAGMLGIVAAALGIASRAQHPDSWASIIGLGVVSIGALMAGTWMLLEWKLPWMWSSW